MAKRELSRLPWSIRRDWRGGLERNGSGDFTVVDATGASVATVRAGYYQEGNAAALAVLPSLVLLAERMQRVPCLNEGRACEGCFTCDARLAMRVMGGPL